MVAFQRNVGRGKRVSRKSVENSPRIRASVNVVPQRYRECVGNGAIGEVLRDEISNLIEQIRATVDVANYIKPDIIR